MQKRTRKQSNQSPKPEQTLREIFLAAGFEEDPNLLDDLCGEEAGGIILSFGGGSPEPHTLAGDLGDIDNDYWELRPVNFDPRTGKRLKRGSRAAHTAMERFDIQQDEHYCVWCGTRIRGHYGPFSQWIPCVELLQRNAVALGRARKQVGG